VSRTGYQGALPLLGLCAVRVGHGPGHAGSARGARRDAARACGAAPCAFPTGVSSAQDTVVTVVHARSSVTGAVRATLLASFLGHVRGGVCRCGEVRRGSGGTSEPGRLGCSGGFRGSPRYLYHPSPAAFSHGGGAAPSHPPRQQGVRGRDGPVQRPHAPERGLCGRCAAVGHV
jgi:hypothetical protein